MKDEIIRNVEAGKGWYFMDGLGIRIKLPIKGIKDYDDMLEIELDVNNGYGNITVEVSKINKCRRPGNVIAKFKWCYSLWNEFNNYIGCVGELEEETEKEEV